MFSGDITERVLLVIVLLLSLTVHEWAHAISAFWLGDDTAAREGRLTLSPIPHIDPVGTLLLPLLGFPLGWAKPVPVVPSRFRRDVNMKTGMMLTAAAGPFSNIVLAFLSLLGIACVAKFAPQLLYQQEGLYAFLSMAFGINVGLAVFNMLPIPPLDGSRVAEWLVPYRMRDQWESFARMAPFVLLLIVVLPSQYNPMGIPIAYVQGVLESTVRWVVGFA